MSPASAPAFEQKISHGNINDMVDSSDAISPLQRRHLRLVSLDTSSQSLRSTIPNIPNIRHWHKGVIGHYGEVESGSLELPSGSASPADSR
jgi:hypothetical protein